MSTAIAWILGIATVLGGIAAVGYFRDKWRAKQQWTEREKIVSTAWWESSDLKTQYEAKGCTDFGWSNPDRLAERMAEGKQVVFEIDHQNQIKYHIVNKSGQVLVCRNGV
jgi:hypothetical protein